MNSLWQIPNEEYHPFYQPYVDQVAGRGPLALLRQGRDVLTAWYHSLPVEKHTFRYAADKWSVKEVLGHLMDSERIFAYRAFRISRGDRTPLAGFDQDPYVPAGRFDEQDLTHLLADYQLLRANTLSLATVFREEQFLLIGNANGAEVSLRAMMAIMAGHELHHYQILRERYA